jgi:hypothetical protein
MCVNPVAGIYSSDKREFDADVSIDESFASGTPKFSDEAFFHFTITELVSSYPPACTREWKGALRSVGTLAVQTVPTCYPRNRGCIKQKSNLKRRPSSASEIREKWVCTVQRPHPCYLTKQSKRLSKEERCRQRCSVVASDPRPRQEVSG